MNMSGPLWCGLNLNHLSPKYYADIVGVKIKFPFHCDITVENNGVKTVNGEL